MEQPHSESVASRLPLNQIVAGYNPRRYFDKKGHDELVASLRLRGMLQPMLVRPAEEPDRYVIVAGGRRYRAALEAFGPDGEVPVVIRVMSDQEALEAAIDENDVREDASETEQADAAVKMLAATGNDKAEAARRLNWSITKLERRLTLATLDGPVKTALDERRIKIGHAELLAAVPADKQTKALETIIQYQLDVNKTRDLLMRVTQDLATAIFDKGECAACPHNSSAQAVLFETHVTEGHCTNASCFAVKTTEAEAIAARQARTQTPPAAAAPSGDTNGDTAHSDDALTADPAPASHRPATAAPAAAKDASTSENAEAASKAKWDADPKAIARKAADTKRITWRKALAKFLATNPRAAREVLVTAAFRNQLTMVIGNSLTAKGRILIDPMFGDLKPTEQLKSVRGLDDDRLETTMCAIAASYAMDCNRFDIIEDYAKAYEIEIGSIWTVNAEYLNLFTKEELRLLGQEFGLVEHMGAKPFSKLLNAKKPDIIKGMLAATGFTWIGLVPAAMTLTGKAILPEQVKPEIAAAAIAQKEAIAEEAGQAIDAAIAQADAATGEDPTSPPQHEPAANEDDDTPVAWLEGVN